jgi:hypothetical protein
LVSLLIFLDTASRDVPLFSGMMVLPFEWHYSMRLQAGNSARVWSEALCIPGLMEPGVHGLGKVRIATSERNGEISLIRKEKRPWRPVGYRPPASVDAGVNALYIASHGH